jgi:glutamate-5-semialdehyde dehydrogenase
MSAIENLARKAKEAAPILAAATTKEKNIALLAMAKSLRKAEKKILSANAEEVKKARAAGKSNAFIDRLALNPERLAAIAQAVENIALLPDPVGERRPFKKRPNGLVIERLRVPLGVIAIIYESRPGVTADAAALCVKSGNCVVLRGGKEAIKTSAAIASALAQGLRAAGLPEEAVSFIDSPDRAAVAELLSLDRFIDLVIPRGGPELCVFVRKNSSIPVLSHDKGLCHTYVEASADLKMAEDICLNAKSERPGVCNAMETLLVDEKIARAFLPSLAQRFKKAGVELRGCPKTLKILPVIKRAAPQDWDTEYLDLILSVKIVGGYEEALSHIARHGSGLAEAIVTSDAKLGKRFQRQVDAGAVFVNASTRFTDGGEFGLGAEIGISTSKIHARGPAALEALTCEKYVITGTGQIRKEGQARS